jgi:MraZ protein
VFTGKYEYSIDDKGRVSIPSKIRAAVGHQGQPEHLYVTPGPKGNLNAYTEAGYARYTDQLSAQRGTDASDLLRYVSSMTDTAPWDKQGRILVNPQLQERAGITRDVIIVGVKSRIEIWDKQRFAEFEAQQQERVKDLFTRADLPADLA